MVYFKDIWRRPIGKFLFTSVVIHSLVCVTQVSPKKSLGVSNLQLLASPEVDVGAANPLHHRLHQLLAEVEQQVAVLRRRGEMIISSRLFFNDMFLLLLVHCQRHPPTTTSCRVWNNFPVKDAFLSTLEKLPTISICTRTQKDLNLIWSSAVC